MSKGRDRGGGRLVMQRCFVQSRYAGEFAAAAYEIIVPEMRRELARSVGKDRRIGGGAVASAWRERSCV